MLRHWKVVVAVALAAVLFFIIGSSIPNAVEPASSISPTAATGPVKPPPCRMIRASKWNQLVRKERDLDGISRKLKNKPVCVRTYKRFKRHVQRVERRQLETNVRYAIAKAFDPIGRTDQAMAVAYCESTLNRFATNGQYLGLFQLGSHHHHRLNGKPYSHAYANARAAAEIVAADGGWSQWECQP